MITNESMLTIGAIILFSLISLHFNSTVLQNVILEVENKVYLTAFSLGDDLLEEIKQKAFDEETVIFRSINPEELTPTTDLGPDDSENSSVDYDDIDDYNGYFKPISLPHAEGFIVGSVVYYVQEDNFNQQSLIQTFYKRVDVTVSSDYLSHPVNLSFVFTLHSK